MAVWSWRFESSLAHPAPSGVCVWHGKPCHPESSGISRRTRRGGLPGKGSSGLFGPTFPVSSEAPRELFVCGRWAGVLGARPLPVSPSSPVGVCRWRGGGAWLNAPASKAGRGHSPLGGSNPSLSARPPVLLLHPEQTLSGTHASLAQAAERENGNFEVPGSNPGGGSKAEAAFLRK